MPSENQNRQVVVTEFFLTEVLLNSAKAHFTTFNAGFLNGSVTMRANKREDAVRDLEDFLLATGFRDIPNSAFKVEEYKEAETPDYSMAGFKAIPRSFFIASIPLSVIVEKAGFRYL